jgi:hypothetical protein
MTGLVGDRRNDDTFVDASGYTWVRLARAWKPGPLPKNLVEQVKRRYLVYMAAVNHQGKASLYAGVSEATIRAWRRRGIISDEEVAEALDRYVRRVSAAMKSSSQS